MNQKIERTFLILVLVQGLHSAEEYVGEIWEKFPPARFLCGLVSDNLVTGFLVINIGLLVFGLWCWLFPIRNTYSYAPILVWFWIVLELINGIGHPIWTVMQKAYTPGIITAPILLVIAIVLFRGKLKEKTNAQQHS